MLEAKRFVLIDGNNLAHRVWWAQNQLQYRQTVIGLLFGFLRSLIALRKKYPNETFVVAWDEGYARRFAESEVGVRKGIIPETYKANRIARQAEPDMADLFESMNVQRDQIRHELLPHLNLVQITVQGSEADDVIYTYVMRNFRVGGTSIVVTSDQDYFQLLRPGVILCDPIKDEVWNRERFQVEFGFDPELWVDVGAIMGDKGDNIFGVNGWGPKTTCQYVREYGTVEEIYAVVEAKPQKKLLKREQELLRSKERIALAYSLKKMDELPCYLSTEPGPCWSTKELEQYMFGYRFASLFKDAWRLV